MFLVNQKPSLKKIVGGIEVQAMTCGWWRAPSQHWSTPLAIFGPGSIEIQSVQASESFNGFHVLKIKGTEWQIYVGMVQICSNLRTFHDIPIYFQRVPG